MLKLEEIQIAFNGRKVLRGVNLEVQKGDFIAIMGCNGAGKSTLFDLIAGSIQPDSGHIFIDGEEVTRQSEIMRAPLIGRLFQNTQLASVSTLTVRENLALATLKGRCAGLQSSLSNYPEEVVERVLKPLNLGLDELLDTPMRALSGGQRQIISLIMTTLVPPRILLLDEPTAALDPKSATELLIFAKEFVTKNQIPTLMITHDPDIARSLANKIAVIEGGVLHTKRKCSGENALNALPDQIDYKRLMRAL